MTSPIVIYVSHLSVKFGNFYAVNNISFSVKRGEIFGFLGANGAGKTTTIRVLCSLLAPTSGAMIIGYEHEVHDKSKIGYMSQKNTLYDDLTVEENLDFLASLRALDSKAYRKRRDSLLELFTFRMPISTLVRDLPLGMKQQVSLAGALLHAPEVIFLDEPTAGVSPAARSVFWSLIHSLSTEGRTVFVTTHHMDEAEHSHRIALMRAGRIIGLDTPEKLKTKTFPNRIFKLTAKHPMNYADLKDLRKRPEFDYFEPYGFHFHVTFRESEEATRFKESLSQDFSIDLIKPTLEDVFIKTVEGETL